MLKQKLIFIIMIFSIIGCNQKSGEIDLKNIENRIALKELVDTFSILADKKDTDAQTFLFTEDAQVYNYDEGKLTTILKGREEIGKAFRDYLALFETVYHINGQQTVNIDGDKADGISYWQGVLSGAAPAAGCRYLGRHSACRGDACNGQHLPQL